ncbi:hypothetical protein C1H76_4602 [Elsinoe australis]|uniref:Uncharacterized protein n=1 Tax=Elsinoe australis TaxID=40998 RepID=A0A4U7B282_9PEZI|nr:hypothetical protein C1H76_4602 [Elsinoe australis]
MAPSRQTSTASSETDAQTFLGVGIARLITRPGQRLMWRYNDHERKVLYAAAPKHYICTSSQMTPEAINGVMLKIELKHLAAYIDKDGEAVFNNVVKKIMDFYSYNMPAFCPLLIWTLEWRAAPSDPISLDRASHTVRVPPLTGPAPRETKTQNGKKSYTGSENIDHLVYDIVRHASLDI